MSANDLGCVKTQIPFLHSQYEQRVGAGVRGVGADRITKIEVGGQRSHSCRSGENDRRYSDARAQSSLASDNPELENPTERKGE